MLRKTVVEEVLAVRVRRSNESLLLSAALASLRVYCLVVPLVLVLIELAELDVELSLLWKLRVEWVGGGAMSCK